MDQLAALGINPGYVLMQILLFIILFMVLRGYLYNPILKALEERKAKIAKGLEDARQNAIARDNAEAEAKELLAGARAEASKLRQEAAVQAEDTAKGIVAKAEEDAKAKLAAVAQDAEEERNRVLADARGQIASIAIAAANKLVGEALDEKRQREIVANFFSQVPADVAGLSGDAAEVTSALPLTDAEQASAKQAIGAGSVTFKVNPSILGGLIVRVGDNVVDNSVSAQMSALSESLK
ncbi:MAG: F0F1 ATP synthase subunit B [Chloroflexi bacterium]|nr:F0F1 ATP synthase subunit B [Chloroflexota bacterium]